MKKQNFAVIGYTKADLDNHFSVSGKAFYIDYMSGEFRYHQDSHIWIPKSICKFSDVNEVGNLSISIPMWFIRNNQLDYNRLEGFKDVVYQ